MVYLREKSRSHLLSIPRDDSYRADTKISAGHRPWYPVMTPLLLAGRRLRYMHWLLSVCTGYKECGKRTGGCLIPSLVRVAVVFLTLIRCVVVIIGYKYTRIALRLQPELPSWQKTREKERKKEKGRKRETRCAGGSSNDKTGSSFGARSESQFSFKFDDISYKKHTFSYYCTLSY